MCDDHDMPGRDYLSANAPNTRGSRGAAASVLGALLDRSVVQIGEAAADARHFDRETIRAVSDVWDNNCFPLFWAATAPGAEEREQRALTVLEWMAGLGEQRRKWMTEQAAAAGYEIEPLLPPAKPYTPGRDYRGYVMAPVRPLTRGAVADLASDYDLATATVHHLRVERAGSRLTAFLQLAAARTFTTGESPSAQPALLALALEDLTEVTFDFRDTLSAALDPTADGIAISLGTGGRFHAASAECYPDDRSWHLSAAGQRADAVTPPRTDQPSPLRRPPFGKLGADAGAAASLLHHAMLQIRSVRYAARADHVPVRGLCEAFAGAGQAVLEAGSRRSARRREAAFRELIRTWALRGGPALTRWFAAALQEQANRSDLLEVPPAPEHTPSSLTGTLPASGPPPQAGLVMAAWTAAHTSYRTDRPASAELQLALPPHAREHPQAPWRLRTLGCTAPDAFHLRTNAFHGPGPLALPGRATAVGRLDLHRGALAVATPDGWSASVT